MAEVEYGNIPDTQRQHISNTVKWYREYETPTLNSFKNNDTIVGGQQGYQIAMWDADYGQNSYLGPGAANNSYMQPVSPSTLSMFVGLSYQGFSTLEDGILLADLGTKESLITAAKLFEGKTYNFMKHQNYYAIGDGSGTLAVVSSVTNPGGTGVFTGTTAAQLTPNQTKGATRLVKGVTYDVIDETSGAVVGTITPLANGQGSATVACTSTGAPNNSGAFVVEQGAYNKVPNGLAKMINNNDRYYQGVNTADNSFLNSSVVDLNGSALASTTINTLKTKVQIRMNVNMKSKIGARFGHMTPGQYTTLANQGFSARQYQAADGQANTTYGYPEAYVEGDVIWVIDADMDEDRVYLRRAGDYFNFELAAFGPDNKDGLTYRQAAGDNGVGASAYYRTFRWWYNLGFNGALSGGNYGSAYVIRAAVTNSQLNAES